MRIYSLFELEIINIQNTLTFKIDRSLDVEYPTRKFGMILDLTADSATGKPAISKTVAQ